EEMGNMVRGVVGIILDNVGIMFGLGVGIGVGGGDGVGGIGGFVGFMILNKRMGGLLDVSGDKLCDGSNGYGNVLGIGRVERG
ncbi:PTS transporter subunit EIIC, partial [Staphylococcus epidermidis]|uniref:PTS transporter subunit EIIC n=1 Tax=Staphylococcus epidermidis TaxID=1282 RepID=UPI00164272B0